MNILQPSIRDLAIIGDRRTLALVSRQGAIVWYCPGRFDSPAFFSGLLDAEKGGGWILEMPAASFKRRDYLEDSAVLETVFASSPGEKWKVTDWMPCGDGTPEGICRLFSEAPSPVTVSIHAAPNYAQDEVDLQRQDGALLVNGSQWLYASHPLRIEGKTIQLALPAGEQGWMALLNRPVEQPDQAMLAGWLDATLCHWREISARITYRGPYEDSVAQSLRALRLLTYEPNGGVIAAGTASLPESLGGSRNYDYRYLWLRDTGMIISALVRASSERQGGQGEDERKFLEFVCASMRQGADKPLPPFVALDHKAAPDEIRLALAGFRGSSPVRIGNGANRQWQLDGFGNVLLAAKLIYNTFDIREHWDTVEQIADYVADHWQEADYGIWEEHTPAQYTTGKVAAACGLHYIADLAPSAEKARRWRSAVQDIRHYVANHCINSEGAYAAIAGGEAVDVSAILFPIWAYTEADSPEMLATVKVLERDYAKDHLYWRHLEETDYAQEGAFLAGTIWMAQYWIMRNDLEKTRRILDAALAYTSDLGFFAEEADPQTGDMLGNFPQTFVHAAFIGAVVDYRNAISDDQGS
jgi:GH15 family glucan-1,4-alpha-glucosidase